MPQLPSLSPPALPAKTTVLPKAISQAPVLPVKPVLRPQAALAKIPMGPNESLLRICGLGAVFFGVFFAFCWTVHVEATMYGAAWAFVACCVTSLIKWNRAAQERERRIQTGGQLRREERRRAEEDYAGQLTEYKAQVEQLTQQHAAAVARVKSDYQREWLEKDQDYQRRYNTYLREQRDYEAAKKQDEEKAIQWKAECEYRMTNEEQVRCELNTTMKQLRATLSAYQSQGNAQFPMLQAARQRFEQARANETADLKKLRQQRQELQLRQFLANKSIQSADIANIASTRKATLVAYGIGSALDIRPDMSVPGFGDVLVEHLLVWRRICESQFRYNPNTQLPTAEVNAVKVKHAQTQQSALAELRGGAAKLESLESEARTAANQQKMEILNLALAHVQAVADLAVCS